MLQNSMTLLVLYIFIRSDILILIASILNLFFNWKEISLLKQGNCCLIFSGQCKLMQELQGFLHQSFL